MSRWPRGEAQVEQLIADKQLQKVIGGQANGAHLLEKAALRAQFGDGFRPFGAMRRRRNELKYPTGPGETTTHDEAQRAIQDAETLLQVAQQLFPTLSIF